MPDGFRDERSPIICAGAVLDACEGLAFLASLDPASLRGEGKLVESLQRVSRDIARSVGRSLDAAARECVPELSALLSLQGRMLQVPPDQIPAIAKEVSAKMREQVQAAFARVSS